MVPAPLPVAPQAARHITTKNAATQNISRIDLTLAELPVSNPFLVLSKQYPMREQGTCLVFIFEQGTGPAFKNEHQARPLSTENVYILCGTVSHQQAFCKGELKECAPAILRGAHSLCRILQNACWQLEVAKRMYTFGGTAEQWSGCGPLHGDCPCPTPPTLSLLAGPA